MLLAALATKVMPTSEPRSFSALAILAAASMMASLPALLPVTISGLRASVSACTIISTFLFRPSAKSLTAGAALSSAWAIAKPKRACSSTGAR
ncbi:hypothetical protein D3C78_1444000 [compost metagenome]